MDKNDILIWLADQLKPRIYKNYLLTSRGLAPFNGFYKHVSAFLRREQINESACAYDSYYDIYYVDYYHFLEQSNIKEYKKYPISAIGDLKCIENGSSYMEFLVFQKELFIFAFEGDILEFVTYLVKEYGLKTIYSKQKIVDECEIIKYYFKSHLETNDVIIDEAYKCGFIGDIKGNIEFNLGEFKYNPSINTYPLLLWPRDNREHYFDLTPVTYYEFLKAVKLIKEFNYEDAVNELATVKNNGGEFFILYENDEIAGMVCFAKNANTYIYISYLAVVEKYRKSDASDKIIESIKSLANEYKKNLLLTIEVTRLYVFYTSRGFKSIGMFNFE